ncbi:MAG: peptide/nickel transport system permease protein [Micromonosporaceae bacterium]|jgi:peptide/nickel transport system permease protein|nr:peptide/nickel transport system permease protein [Micromonosporaceae bacterium]
MTDTSRADGDLASRSLVSDAGVTVAVNSPVDELAVSAALPPSTLVGRSPRQLAWIRLKRDRTALLSACVVVFFILLALVAPLVEKLYGISPTERFGDLMTLRGEPLGYLGGISGDHWFGIQPQLGRDILMQLVYGLRTSLSISFAAAIITTVVGVLVGVVAGYFGGWIDAIISWFTDVVLAFPFLIFTIAVIPLVTVRFYGARDAIPASFKVYLIIGIFAVFSWAGVARLVRGQVISLREREYVDAARAAGAGPLHILFRQLLPNTWAPILVSFSLALPAFITAEAALSFLSIGISEPQPDLGRMINDSTKWLEADPAYLFFPGVTLVLLVLAFNLLGDSLRDALDPKSIG